MNTYTSVSQSRVDLARLFTGTGAEIGVEQGEFSEVICKYSTKLYAVDAWRPYSGYTDHTRKDKLYGFYEATKERLAPYNCEIIKGFSMDAVSLFDDDTLDFVYIDANHNYKYVLEDIEQWTEVVKPGGIVSGHDYDIRWRRRLISPSIGLRTLTFLRLPD
jgi:hypothetical protein